MKAVKKHSALEGIKKEQLSQGIHLRIKRRVFTLEFKAEVVRHKKAENLSLAECGRKFDVLPKLIQEWEKQYEAGRLTAAAGRRAVSPEQAEITRLCAELSRSKMEAGILKKQRRTLRKKVCEVRLHSCRTVDVPPVGGLPGAGCHPGGLPRVVWPWVIEARTRA